jgi:hypothetical protein
MALTATAVSDNNLFGPDVVMYDIADSGVGAATSVTFDPALVWTPEFCLIQPTSTADIGRNWGASINTTTGEVTVSQAVTAAAVASARCFIGRWPKPQNHN